MSGMGLGGSSFKTGESSVTSGAASSTNRSAGVNPTPHKLTYSTRSPGGNPHNPHDPAAQAGFRPAHAGGSGSSSMQVPADLASGTGSLNVNLQPMPPGYSPSAGG